jgi:hypothetical protein
MLKDKVALVTGPGLFHPDGAMPHPCSDAPLVAALGNNSQWPLLRAALPNVMAKHLGLFGFLRCRER